MDPLPVDEYTGMANLREAFYILSIGGHDGVAIPEGPGWVTVTPGGGSVTVVAATEWDALKITFAAYDEKPEPLPVDWTHTEEFAFTANDRPADYTSGTSTSSMVENPLPPEYFFAREGEPPYHWNARLHVAAYEVEEHAIQFWRRG
ncbi:hypothetical protein [Streptomyces sp. RPT161]|uniref:hypothetical protein n=1 Tax=Streptomyces sp. RPT161 TaxID=3015993 RepID=UPI0022B8F25D|nr:hypothetical protein [Streptomyces sp. RPT161]